jgi:short-subunit dehydrogenase
MALAFAQRGDHVAASARRLDRLDSLVAAAKGVPGQIIALDGDVTSESDMQSAANEIENQWGRLDVLVANAGLGQRGSIVDSEWNDLETVLRTNVEGVLLSVRAAVPLMRKSGGGHIITVSSVTAIAVPPYATVYGASKAALSALARGLRLELAPDHIWVTNVIMGQTATEFAEKRRGQSGRVAERLPTMSAAFAAQRIVRETDRRRRTVILRPLDRLIVLAGAFLPGLIDRILMRIYKPKPRIG